MVFTCCHSDKKWFASLRDLNQAQLLIMMMDHTRTDSTPSKYNTRSTISGTKSTAGSIIKIHIANTETDAYHHPISHSPHDKNTNKEIFPNHQGVFHIYTPSLV